MEALVLGHNGLVGQALLLKMPASRITDLDLTESTVVPIEGQPVYLAAARVGGIQTNIDCAADMIDGNLTIATRIIRVCTMTKSKLCFLGSSCIYPRITPQPIPESALMTGPLEPTNSAYAMAKLAGIEMCRAYARQYKLRFVALMPCNLYGPGRPKDTHVINMLMKRLHEAKLRGDKSVTIWGTGVPFREFMHVDDCADAAMYFMGLDKHPDLINVGTGVEIDISGLAMLLREIVGFKGDVLFDPTKPDGTPRKVLDVSLANKLGWSAKIPLAQGLEQTYRWYVENGEWL